MRPWQALGLIALALGCATADTAGPDAAASGPADPNRTQLRVEVYRGVAPARLPEPDLHVLLDVTPLIQPGDPPDPGADLTALAQQMLRRLEVEGDLAEAQLHPFHRTRNARDDESCPAGGEGGRETHLSRQVDQLTGSLRGSGVSRPTRVVLASDLSAECAVRLCDSAGGLIAAGAWIDLMQVGPGQPPSCITGMRPAAVPARDLALSLAGPPPAFRVEEALPKDGGQVLARGVALGAPVEVDPGYRTVVIELDPVERVGPLLLERGQRVRVRLMEFPLSAPDERQWEVEVVDEGR